MEMIHLRSVTVTISQELADDKPALDEYLFRMQQQGFYVVSMTIIHSSAHWHEEDKLIPFGGKPSETP